MCEKTRELKKAIEDCAKTFVDDDTMMHDVNKSASNRMRALRTQLELVENNVEYKQADNAHIYEIIHPISKQRVKLTSKSKAFIDGKWKNNITVSDVANWYHNNGDSIINNYNTSPKNENKTLLEQASTAKNKTKRKEFLSKFLQTNNLGALDQNNSILFIKLYDKYYMNNDKYDRRSIQGVRIERGDYNSKCFGLIVDGNICIISKQHFH